MTALIAWTTTALASPGMAGAVHLGSAPVEPGATWAGSGAFALWAPFDAVGGVLLEVGGAIGDRIVVDLQLGTDLETAAAFPAAFAGRYLLVDEEDVRVAATVSAFYLPMRPDHRIGDSWAYGALSPGIALDAGGEKVRFDLAVPIWGFTVWDQYPGLSKEPFPLLGTVGVCARVSDRTRLRFGLPELLSVGWRSEDVYFDLGGFTILAAGVVWTKFGFVF